MGNQIDGTYMMKDDFSDSINDIILKIVRPQETIIIIILIIMEDFLVEYSGRNINSGHTWLHRE